jgi:hypothetical protein
MGAIGDSAVGTASGHGAVFLGGVRFDGSAGAMAAGARFHLAIVFLPSILTDCAVRSVLSRCPILAHDPRGSNDSILGGELPQPVFTSDGSPQFLPELTPQPESRLR